MRDAQAVTIYRQDYQPSAFTIERTELHFALYEDHCLVTAELAVSRRSEATDTTLELQGQELELISLALNGRELSGEQFESDAENLRIHDVPEQFELRCITRIYPQRNKALEGMYKSSGMFCTQCEAEGFRKITYFLDRPDVMSTYTVHIEADASRYPVLLSNGNCVAERALADGRHSVTWHDPWPKPSYLFALVAGQLEHVEDQFTTATGRSVCLRIYVEAKDLGKCDHAMAALQRSMRWDEEVYGREYDLDIFNIVAVDDFNMGAMENKSLNIFNSSCVLCSPDTATDTTFQTVEAIVAHEYFHNWSGNRVTCRDWFQLSLKEGFTVFRDAEFSADMGSRAVKRVQDVALLRSAQFPEDAGPLAHPVRPDSFIEISNFYTATVYEKGAEVVRMIHTLLGPEQFRAGSDLYFERHDGQAVTCEDFVCAMEDASGVDLGQFRRWYEQAGTPVLRVEDSYDTDAQRYTLTVHQHTPDTPGQQDKKPLLIPLAMGLLGDAGHLPLRLEGEPVDAETSDNTHRVLLVSEASQRFEFSGVIERPVPALLRGFSAPVKLQYPYSNAELAALMSRESDGFVRWDAAQQLAANVIAGFERNEPEVADTLVRACGALLADESLDAAMVAMMLRLPAVSYLVELAAAQGGADVHAIHAAREQCLAAVAKANVERFAERYTQLACDEPFAACASQIAGRALRNTSLDYLVIAGEGMALARQQFEQATNMTDRLAALNTLACRGDHAVAQEVLEAFHQRWQADSLVLNQWFQVQALIPHGDAVARVRALLDHADFDWGNPNKLRALVGQFANNNLVNFHREDGAGYQLLADVVAELDTRNPQVAARLITPLTRWRNYRSGGELMSAQLQRLADAPKLSKDLYEVVSKSL